MYTSAATSESIGLVIPTYNRADLIGETLESALSQTIPFQSVVVVDNGSTDHTAAVVASFGPAVTYLQVPNVGVQAARNLGVQKLVTPWTALCDSDDVLHSRFVESAQAAMRLDSSFDALCTNFENFEGLHTWADKFSQAPPGWFEGARRVGQLILDVPDLLSRNLGFQPVFPSGLVLRTSTYRELGGYDTAFRGIGAEDWEFALRLMVRSRLAFNTEVLVRIRRHAGNDSANGLRMLLGECQILNHALNTMPEVRSLEPQVMRTIVSRQSLAFDAAFAAGDFTQARDILRQRFGVLSDARRWIKRSILSLPPSVRRQLWNWSQGEGAKPEIAQRVTVVEPAWTGVAHLPANIGFLEYVLYAFPRALVCFVGDPGQISHIRAELDFSLQARLSFHAWDCHSDEFPSFSDTYCALKRWRALPQVLTYGAHRILLTSVTPTSLAALHWMGLADRSAGVLHGNAIDLEGWRSRHPIRRELDLSAALKRFVCAGGLALVLEPRIQALLVQRLSWLAGRVEVVPHPVSSREARSYEPGLALDEYGSHLVRIAYVGMATRAKGFLEFLEVARYLNQEAPGRFEFHAIGMLNPSLEGMDQSCLATPAGHPLPRPKFLNRLRQMDFLFSWQAEDYYGTAASGVLYDAVNQLVPLLARRGTQIAAWQAMRLNVGFAFDELQDLKRLLIQSSRAELFRERAVQVAHLAQIRQGLSPEVIGPRLAQICSRLRCGLVQ